MPHQQGPDTLGAATMPPTPRRAPRSGGTLILSALILFAAPASAATFLVTKTTDDDGPCTVDDCALREAVIAARANPHTSDVIRIPGGTYQLALPGPGEWDSRTGDLNLWGWIDLRGDPLDPAVIVGDGTDRVLQLAGATGTIEHLVLRGGVAPIDGGAIDAIGSVLRLHAVVIEGNQAHRDGGGIASVLTELVVSRSVIRGNLAVGGGGGIAALQPLEYGTCDLALLNTTVSGNNADHGGGLSVPYDCVVNIAHSTIANNDATSSTGIDSDDARLEFSSSIIVGTCSEGSRRSLTNGHNLESPGDSCFPAGSGDLVHVADPALGPLADNGGPTWTHLLLPGSPAIDAALDADCEGTDQRGYSRPRDGDRDGFAVCDIGAVEIGEALTLLDVPAFGSAGLLWLVGLLGAAGTLLLQRRT